MLGTGRHALTISAKAMTTYMHQTAKQNPPVVPLRPPAAPKFAPRFLPALVFAAIGLMLIAGSWQFCHLTTQVIRHEKDMLLSHTASVARSFIARISTRCLSPGMCATFAYRHSAESFQPRRATSVCEVFPSRADGNISSRRVIDQSPRATRGTICAFRTVCTHFQNGCPVSPAIGNDRPQSLRLSPY